MRVLVVGSVPVSAASATDELEAAGHEVLRCHEESGPAFPCVALADGAGCPLQGEPVDVVLDVHDARTMAPSPYERASTRHALTVEEASAMLHDVPRSPTRRCCRDR